MCMEIIMGIVSALATVGIFFVAWFQLHHMREESKRDRTLKICFSYDSDPVISISVEKLRNNKELTEHDKRTLLNYFDVIAIGVAQNSYEFEIIYPQFKNIIPVTTKQIDIDDYDEGYPDLQNLIEKIQTRKRNESCA